MCVEFKYARLLVLLASCMLLNATCYGDEVAYPIALKGVIDLRTIDLNKQTIKLQGEWEFYWKQLLTRWP